MAVGTVDNLFLPKIFGLKEAPAPPPSLNGTAIKKYLFSASLTGNNKTDIFLVVRPQNGVWARENDICKAKIRVSSGVLALYLF